MIDNGKGTAGVNFGEALEALKVTRGTLIHRLGWNGKGQTVGLQIPDANSMNSLPYLFIVTVAGDRVPWVASQTDMLASDWQVVAPLDEEKEPE